jgi:hypothetical protein
MMRPTKHHQSEDATPHLRLHHSSTTRGLVSYTRHASHRSHAQPSLSWMIDPSVLPHPPRCRFLYNPPVTRHSHVVPKPHLLPCAHTNGCTLGCFGSAFVRQLAAPGPSVCRPLPAFQPFCSCTVCIYSSALRCSSSVKHMDMKYETASPQWGIPAAIWPFRACVRSPSALHPNTHGYAGHPYSLAAAIDQVGGFIEMIPAETYAR